MRFVREGFPQLGIWPIWLTRLGKHLIFGAVEPRWRRVDLGNKLREIGHGRQEFVASRYAGDVIFKPPLRSVVARGHELGNSSQIFNRCFAVFGVALEYLLGAFLARFQFLQSVHR